MPTCKAETCLPKSPTGFWVGSGGGLSSKLSDTEKTRASLALLNNSISSNTSHWTMKTLQVWTSVRQLDLHEFVLLGTLMVVGLRVVLGLAEETPPLSALRTGLIWTAPAQLAIHDKLSCCWWPMCCLMWNNSKYHRGKYTVWFCYCGSKVIEFPKLQIWLIFKTGNEKQCKKQRFLIKHLQVFSLICCDAWSQNRFWKMFNNLWPLLFCFLHKSARCDHLSEVIQRGFK